VPVPEYCKLTSLQADGIKPNLRHQAQPSKKQQEPQVMLVLQMLHHLHAPVSFKGNPKMSLSKYKIVALPCSATFHVVWMLHNCPNPVLPVNIV
jgi:hypothetical protein